METVAATSAARPKALPVRRYMPKMTRREFLRWCRDNPKQLARELVRVTTGF